MSIALAIILLAFLPNDGIVRDHVDVIELNHFYNEEGRHVLDQFIFWEWDRYEGRHHILAWRMANQVAPFPQGAWITDESCLRRVTSISRRETWTQHDPEIVDRQVLPVQERVEFPKP